MRQYTFHPHCSAATNNMSLRECYLHVIGGPYRMAVPRKPRIEKFARLGIMCIGLLSCSIVVRIELSVRLKRHVCLSIRIYRREETCARLDRRGAKERQQGWG